MVGPAVFEDIEINNLKTGDIAVFNLPLLKRVRLEGKIGKLKISNTGFDLTQSLSGEILRFKNDFLCRHRLGFGHLARPNFRFLLLGRARPFNHNQPRKPVCRPTKPHSGKRRVGFRFRRQASGCGRYVAVSHRFGRKRNRARRADGKGKKQRDAVLAGLLELKERGIVA